MKNDYLRFFLVVLISLFFLSCSFNDLNAEEYSISSTVNLGKTMCSIPFEPKEQDVDAAYELLKKGITSNMGVTVVSRPELLKYDFDLNNVINDKDYIILENTHTAYKANRGRQEGLKILNNDRFHGEMTVLVVLVQFPDQEFNEETIQTGEHNLLNNPGATVWDFCNSVDADDDILSVKERFSLWSMGIFDINFVVLNNIMTAENNRGWYNAQPMQDVDSILVGEYAGWKNATPAVQRQLQDLGYSLMIFLIAGQSEDYSDGLWPHYAPSGYIRNTNTPLIVISDTEGTGKIRTICHELGHHAGSPDMYVVDNDYADSSEMDPTTGAGGWDLMATGGIPGAYLYNLLGWRNVETITSNVAGASILNSHTELNHSIYRLMPEGKEHSMDYFLVEYRKTENGDIYSRFYECQPDGIFIYHVYSDGTQTLLDQVHIEQADGLNELNYDNRDPVNYDNCDDGDYWTAGNEFSDDTTPDSKTNRGDRSYVAVKNIRIGDGIGSADLLVCDYDSLLLEGVRTNPDVVSANVINIFDFENQVVFNVYGDGDMERQMPSGAYTLTSSSPRVAVIGANNVLRVVGRGETVITARCGNLISNRVTLRVQPANFRFNFSPITGQEHIPLRQSANNVKLVMPNRVAFELFAFNIDRSLEKNVTGIAAYAYNNSIVTVGAGRVIGNINPLLKGSTVMTASIGANRSVPVTIDVYEIVKLFLYPYPGILMTQGQSIDFKAEYVLNKGVIPSERIEVNSLGGSLESRFECELVQGFFGNNFNFNNTTGILSNTIANFEVNVYAKEGDIESNRVHVACLNRGVVLSINTGANAVAVGGKLTLSSYATINGNKFLISSGVRWTSLDPNLAVIDQYGVVTGAAVGRARIRVTYMGFSANAVITVLRNRINVQPPAGANVVVPAPANHGGV